VREQIVTHVRRLTGVQVNEVEVSVDHLAAPDTYLAQDIAQNFSWADAV